MGAVQVLGETSIPFSFHQKIYVLSIHQGQAYCTLALKDII